MIKKLFTQYIDYSLILPMEEEIKLVEEYKYKFSQLNIPNNNISSEWTNNINRLKELVSKDDLRCFLRWDIIQNTMFVTYSHYIIKELFYLMKLSNWKNKWKIAIKESYAGYPLPFFLYRQSSSNLIHHAYHLARFQEVTNINYEMIKNILEFGGGYGSMCRLSRNLNFNGQYIIYDLAPFCLLQEFYFKLLSLINVHENKNYIKNIHSISNIDIIKNKIIDSKTISSDDSLFIATWSLSESPYEIRFEIEKILSQFKYILIAYQGVFGKYNNIEYFINLKEKFSKYSWVSQQIEHMPGNYYLFGKL